MRLTSFQHVLDFPKRDNVVYVLFYTRKSDDDATPFYVGETSGFTGRMADYFRATFAAATDFKVGEAIRYLVKHDVRVRVGYNECVDRKTARLQKSRLIEAYTAEGFLLLNNLRGFDYRKALKQDELARVHAFCDDILKAQLGCF